MLDSALDVCQHAPKFIADKTCLGAPGGRILAKCGTKFVRFGSSQNLSAGCFISLLLSLFWWRTQPSKICRNLSEKINAFSLMSKVDLDAAKDYWVGF